MKGMVEGIGKLTFPSPMVPNTGLVAAEKGRISAEGCDDGYDRESISFSSEKWQVVG